VRGREVVMEERGIPDDLRILLPEVSAEVVVIGDQAYRLRPLTEGQAELLSVELSEIVDRVFTTDMLCPVCGARYPSALGKMDACPKLECAGAVLRSAQESPIKAVMESGRVARLVEKILDIPASIVQKKATLPQLMHFAGVLWKQNFSRSALPEESRKNFEGLLSWMGLRTDPARKPPEM
jgi:hypothetical protein